jgi:hypothetical protein
VSLYATIEDAKAYIAGEDQRSSNDDRILAALTSASRKIDSYCGRPFYRVVDAASSASLRTYYPDTSYRVTLDDMWTTTGLVVATDTSDNGTADTTWLAADYQLEPLNGVVDGLDGWPYYRLRAVAGRSFPQGKRPSVHVTAKWGWSAVPDPVKQACLHLTSTIYKMEDAPLGVAALNDFGPLRMSADLTRYVGSLLDPYVKVSTVYGIG